MTPHKPPIPVAVSFSLPFDFTTEAGRRGWEPSHDIARLIVVPEGLRIEISGSDPYTAGPPVAVPTAQPLWLNLLLRASQSGMGQVFYFPSSASPTEQASARFPVRAGRWEKIRVPLPALPTAPTYRFRIDPPGGKGATAVIARLSITPRVLLTEPAWPRPTMPLVPPGSPAVRSGDLELIHGPAFGSFVIQVAGEQMAVGNTRPQVIYQATSDGPLHAINLWEKVRTTARAEGAGLRLHAVFQDAEGADWTLEHWFRPGSRKGTLEAEVTVHVSRERRVAHLPLLTLLPGVGSFGEGKGQALFCGLEYLDRDEPSSSEADVKGPSALRHVPDASLVTIPIMALQARDRWVALAWEPSSDVAACFDTPDRRFHSGGHLMALLFPGTEGMNTRPPGALLPYEGRLLRPGKRVTVHALLMGGAGESVVPAVQAYAAVRGLPEPPKTDPPATTRLMAAGWLASGVRVGNRYRHAYPGDFGAQLAADAALCEDWLAGQIARREPDLANQLLAAARKAIVAVPPQERNSAAVGHIRTPAPALVYGGLFECMERARAEARDLLGRFAPDGSVPYRASPGRKDYGTTHFANHANGLTTEVVARVLDAALLTGDAELTREGLRRLSQLNTLYRASAPRGAQTWEVPLHTPDILASANLVRAFLRGYELSGDRRLRDEAVYWAWTGVPFVYLTPPVSEPVGLYGTIAVLGATNWEAPLWIGLPVQWCGLVYADALYDLVKHDPEGPWRRLADGIVSSGIQQTWPIGVDRLRQGLLPDSWNLPGQLRNDVAINPATLLLPYARSLGRPLYEHLCAAPSGPYIHAPGTAKGDDLHDPKRLRFTVDGWAAGTYTILLASVPDAPLAIRVNGRPVQFTHHSRDGWLFVEARGKARVEVDRK